MQKRAIIFGDYNTAAHGWTLTGWRLDAAEQKTNYVEKTGGDGSWDLSTAMTDGIPRYRDRGLTVSLECSEGNRLARKEIIRQMVNQLDGMRVSIELPDDPAHYVVGRLRVVPEYNDLAHAAVTVTAVCEPWMYSKEETKVNLTATSTSKTAQVVNVGRRAVVPLLTVAGGSVSLTYNGATIVLNEGTHKWTHLLLTPGTHDLEYSGTGRLTISYREAVLE